MKQPGQKYLMTIKSKCSESKLPWAYFALALFKTMSKNPSYTPKTCLGCFSFYTNGVLRIFWQSVPKRFHNGDDFHYLLKMGNEKIYFHREVQNTEVSFDHNNEGPLNIEIFSENKVGPSRLSTALTFHNIIHHS
jgi:hypothetical protein